MQRWFSSHDADPAGKPSETCNRGADVFERHEVWLAVVTNEAGAICTVKVAGIGDVDLDDGVFTDRPHRALSAMAFFASSSSRYRS